MRFKDHFSGHAVDYARFRPHYLQELFDYLASISPRRDLPWDCATGNGQPAIQFGALPRLRHWNRRQRATNRKCGATCTNQLPDRTGTREWHRFAFGRPDRSRASAPLVRVRSSFRRGRASVEAGGVLAVSNYIHAKISPAIDSIIGRFYRDTTGPFWPQDRAPVEAGYHSIAFPFAELPSRRFEMSERWNLNELAGYLRTWSAVQRFIGVHGIDPVDDLMKELDVVWGMQRRRTK